MAITDDDLLLLYRKRRDALLTDGTRLATQTNDLGNWLAQINLERESVQDAMLTQLMNVPFVPRDDDSDEEATA